MKTGENRNAGTETSVKKNEYETVTATRMNTGIKTATGTKPENRVGQE